MSHYCNYFLTPPLPTPHSMAAYMHQWTGAALVQIMAGRLYGAKPLPEAMLTYCQVPPRSKFQSNFNKNSNIFVKKCAWKCRLRNDFIRGGGGGVKLCSPSLCSLSSGCVVGSAAMLVAPVSRSMSSTVVKEGQQGKNSRAPFQYKDRLSQLWDSLVKDKAVTRPSYL